MKAELLAACISLATQTYQVPPAALIGIMSVEGGRVGQEVGNKNGSKDLGPMQINTLWLRDLASAWNTDEATARSWVRDDPCVNINVAAWILHTKIDEAGGDIWAGIARYHSATPHLGQRYQAKVAASLESMGLLHD